MLKKHLSLLFFTLFLFSNAQFEGRYNMHDGGVDVQNSALLILPEHEFMIFYLGGYKKGTWKELDKNSIELTETKSSSNPILLYGKTDKAKTGNVNFDVIYLFKAHSLIRFSKDENFSEEMKPVFNNWPNCMDQKYVFHKKQGEYNYVNISIPASPEFGHLGIQYPYKVLNYTFPLDKKYNQFTFMYNEDANTNIFTLKITKDGNSYFMENYGEKRETEREDFDKKMLAEIAESKDYIRKQEIRTDLGTQITGVQNEKEIIYKLNPNPYFKAFCEDSNEENSGPDYYSKPRELKEIIREDGVYTISNYNENNIKSDEFVVAKISSLNKKDFLTAVKQVSDYDGYEIKINFTKEGTEKFKKLLKENPRKPVAFVIDHKIIDFYDHYFHENSSEALIGNGISEKVLDDIVNKINTKN